MHSIGNIETFPLRYPEPNNNGKLRTVALVRIETEDGLVGWGECIAQPPEAALAAKVIVELGLAPLLLGQDATQVGLLWSRMRDYAFWHGNGGIVSFAISAVDIALWDIAGKAAGLPVAELLGGRLHDSVPACASVILNTLDLDALANEFSSYRDRGFGAVKGGWGQVVSAGFGMNRQRDLEVARTVRDAIGPDIEMALDVSAYAKWTASEATKMAIALEEVQLTWLEDALHHEDHDGYRRMRNMVPTALATGERCWTLSDYHRLVRANCVDIILVDPGRADGISGMKAVVDDAAMHDVRFVPHSWSSAINTAAALHVYAASPNGQVFEVKPAPSPMQHELVRTPFDQVDGRIAVPAEPGLGVDVQEDVVRKYLFSS